MIGAVDIGGTKIAVAAVSEHGRIVARAQWPTGVAAEPKAAVRRMALLLRECAAQAGARLCGIGVGCTGPVDPSNGTVGNVDLLPGWSGFPLAQRLEDELALPVAVENDADAAALAEATWGAGQGARRFLYVTVSTGIGAGIVMDGKLYRGADGAHPELGHQTLDASAGPLCYCGATGCWESLASGPALALWAIANAEAGKPLAADITARDVCELARQGDELALRAVRREAEYIGIGLANLVTIFCPDVIALGGGVMESADLFLERARETMRSRCGLVPVGRISIVPASLRADAALLGAARVWQTRFQESGVETSAR